MTISGLLIAIEIILTYEKLFQIAIIASLAMFGKPCILVISSLPLFYVFR